MIVLRSDDEIGVIRQAGRILAATLMKLKSCVRPGITTKELDSMARDEIIKNDGCPAFRGYKGFPGNICTSVNEVVVHGIPSSRKIKEGDIVKLDVGVKFRNYFADAALTVGAGKISKSAEKLIDVTERALAAGINNAIPGRHISDISSHIQELVEANGFNCVRALVGHGIGTSIHEEPEVPNYGRPGTGPRIEPGMVLAIEPMVNAGTHEIEILEDGWTIVTKDRSLSAHFEHTIVIREGGAEILTHV